MSLQLERCWCLDLYIMILILWPRRAQLPDRSNGFGLAARERLDGHIMYMRGLM
jgi:hypothetical protein